MIEAGFLAYDLREMEVDRPTASFGSGWILLCLALAAHVVDGARSGFAATYSPWVVIAPMFASRSELAGAIFLVIILLALTPFARRGSRWMRVVAYVLAALAMLRGVGIVVVLGMVVRTNRFVAAIPGLYSSPLLVVAAGFLLYCLRRSAPKEGAARQPAAAR